MRYNENIVMAAICESLPALEGVVILLYNQQVAGEKTVRSTLLRNRRGFSQADARFFSVLAEKLLAGRHLTPEGAYTVIYRIMKYNKQVARLLNERRQAAGA